MLMFRNDYSYGAHPKVLEALCKTNLEGNIGYGDDAYTDRAKALIRELCACPEAMVEFLIGGTQRLPRIVGVSKAMELILTAKTIGAAEAKAIGLVSEVYPPEELMPKALEMANAICANAQIAVCESKRCIRKGMQTDIYTGSAFEAEAFGVTCGTEDKDEGMGAFLEKRKEKNFQNR